MNESVPVSPRPDANHLAMKVARSILDAAHDFNFTFGGARFEVAVERLPTSPWPASGVEGLSPDADGPWPRAALLRCSWSGGAVTLRMEASYWRTTGRYRHLVGIAVVAVVARQNVLWITLALPLRAAKDATEAVVEASFAPFRTRNEPEDPTFSRAHAAREVMVRAQLPFTSEYHVEACRVSVPEGTVLPSPSETFERLARLGILKLPFFLRDAEGIEGAPPFEIPSAPSSAAVPQPAASQMDGKRASIWPLPGGVRHHKTTLDALLAEVTREPMTVEAFHELLRERYEVHGPTARKGYLGVLTSLGYCSSTDQRVAVTADGEAYLATRDPVALFERIHAGFAGVLDVLVIASALGRADTDRTFRLLRSLLHVDWATTNQVAFRRNWLLSLGLTERSSEGDAVTELGQRVLDSHSVEVAAIRGRLRSNRRRGWLGRR